MISRVALENVNFYLLLALAEGPKHGLGIQQQIVGDGAGLYVRSTTIYAALRVLVGDRDD
jgi:DNA-binding PadR family transcriptional regulator